MKHRQGQTGFQSGEQQFWCSMDPAVSTIEPDTAVTLGIRPRAFELAPQEGPDTLSAVTDIIEPMGAETLVHLLEEGNDLRVVLRRGTAPAVGERVHLRFKPGQVLLFGPKGELVCQ